MVLAYKGCVSMDNFLLHQRHSIAVRVFVELSVFSGLLVSVGVWGS